MREIIHVPSVRAKMEGNFDYIRLSDFGETSADEVRKALLDGKQRRARVHPRPARQRRRPARMPRCRSRACSFRKGRSSRRSSRRRTHQSEALGTAIGGLATARHSREQVHGQRFRDHLRRAARLPPRHADRHAHVRQRRRAEHLSDARPRRAKNHDRALRHAARPRYPTPAASIPISWSIKIPIHPSSTRPPTNNLPPPRPTTRTLTLIWNHEALLCSVYRQRSSPPRSSRCRQRPAPLRRRDGGSHFAGRRGRNRDRLSSPHDRLLQESRSAGGARHRAFASFSRRCEPRASTGASLHALKSSDANGANIRGIDHEVEVAASESHAKFTVHQLSYIALDAMMRSVNDRYTVFLTPKEFAGLNEGLDGGDFGGTGIVIQVDDQTKYISVRTSFPTVRPIRRAFSKTTSSPRSTASRPKALTFSKPARNCAAKKARAFR